MHAILRRLASRWVLTGIGALLLILLVWFLGPAFAALRSIVVRAALCVLILLVWALANWLADRRARRGEAALAEGVAGANAAETARDEEVAALRDKLGRAMALLRRASGTRGYLYEQPWYMIIGPPGAGKTTALLNAGLKFPLAAEMGQGAVAGVGGTRLCDWWFTEQAVLIDTAGRYTTQDSDAAVDRAGWDGFLDLLRRTRPRQPLNGVLVAIAAPDLAQAAAAERLDHARAIRRRIKELNERLGLRLPVYALFTKLDLLSGFTEFFDDLDRERRDQVWGETFPMSAEETGPAGRTAAALHDLLQRLDARLIDRLQAERSPERRVLMAGFPAQFASLEAPLQEFVGEAFGGSRLDPAPLLRGIYFTSGTQAGTPIDRLTGALARLFGVDQRRAPSLQPAQGRSYFLGGLLRGVVFNEAMLAGGQAGAGRRRLARWGGFAACVVLAGGLIAILLLARAGQMQDATRVQAAASRYQATAAAAQLDPVADSDLVAVLPVLDQARALPFGVDHAAAGGFGWGLSQRDKYHAGAVALYQRTLVRVMLPRLLLRLEGQIRDNLARPDFLYEALRVYLMLGGQGPMDRDTTRAWEQIDWSNLYPDPAMQATLLRHLDAMLDAPLPAVDLDGGLIGDARSALSRISLAAQVYAQIRLSGAAQALPAWTPADALGPAGVDVFTRTSGKPLTAGIPGLYTVQGFHGVLLPGLPEQAAAAARESWVMGKAAQVELDGPGMRRLQDDVVQLYERDYETQWDAMLADLSIVPLGSSDQATRTLYVLSSPQSPFRSVMNALARQLTLSKAPPGIGQAEGALAKLTDSSTARLRGLMGEAKPSVPPGTDVDEHYKAFRDYVGTGPGAPIETTLKLLSDLQAQMAAAASAGAGAAAPPATGGTNPAALLKADAAGQPAAVRGMLQTLAGGSDTLRSGDARKAMADAYNAPDGPATLCGSAVDGRYPFVAGASSEIPLDDFGRLFGPGGQLDAFFTAQLRPFVQTGKVWHVQPVAGVAAPISDADLAEFQRAFAIRDLFFAAGGTQPSVRFTIEPESLDAGAKQVTLDLGGTLISYAHGPSRPVEVTWPGPQGMNSTRLSFDPPASESFSADGPWALFRLIEGRLSRGASPELYELSFGSGDRHAVFQLRAGSVLNPFAPGVLQGFRCPQIQ